MAAVDPDGVDRVAKLLVDAGDAPSFDAAAELLRTYRLQVVAGAEACRHAAWQAALLTAVNAGRRAVHGGMRVVLAEDPDCLVPIARGMPLSAALRSFGAELVSHIEPDVPTIAVCADPSTLTSAPVVWLGAGAWIARVSTTPQAVETSAPPAEVPAAVLAACLGVSELFQWLRGNPVAGERELTVSLWDPRVPTAEGPPLAELPGSLWLLGLGHLGQAYAWLLALLPYEAEGSRPLFLHDDDRLTAANQATSMLHSDEQLGIRKTRLCAAALDPLGWDTHILERRFAGERLHQPGDATALLGGVDNPQARHRLDDAGMPLVLDAGLGAGPDGFLSIAVRRLPGSRASSEIWPATAPAPRPVPPAAVGAYVALEGQTGDRCGVELLAGRTVATAFVGVAAACLVIGGLLRELHGGRVLELVDVSLRDPSGLTALAAPAMPPPRIATVPARR